MNFLYFPFGPSYYACVCKIALAQLNHPIENSRNLNNEHE